MYTYKIYRRSLLRKGKRMRRRILKIITFALLTLSLVTSYGFAEELDLDVRSDNIDSITEVEDMKSAIKNDVDGATNSSTATSGLTISKTISEYDIIKNLRGYSKSELKGLGYTDSDIKAIKAPMKAKEKYGNVTYTIKYSNMYQKKGETFIKTTMTWDWSSAPIMQYTDIAAMTTSETFTKDSANSTVQYYKYGNKKIKSIKSNPTVKTKNSGRGVFIRIKMKKNYDKSEHAYKDIALSGKITASWSVGKKVKQVGVSSNYGHSKIKCDISASFGSGASISFTPEKKVQYGDEAYEKQGLNS